MPEIMTMVGTTLYEKAMKQLRNDIEANTELFLDNYREALKAANGGRLVQNADYWMKTAIKDHLNKALEDGSHISCCVKRHIVNTIVNTIELAEIRVPVEEPDHP